MKSHLREVISKGLAEGIKDGKINENQLPEIIAKLSKEKNQEKIEKLIDEIKKDKNNVINVLDNE